MKNILKTGLLAFIAMAISFTSCNEDDPATPADDSRYMQEDQMARPAINTVFVSSGDKDAFNTTVPSKQGAAFANKFNDKLLALNPAYSTNALGLDAATFTSVLATDVLTVATQGKTTFFDGTNVLTGRQLADDVISVELLLIFGGPEGTDNPSLTDDNVDANDKAFLSTFPYLATPH
ncbi:MAG: DUF4331 family protein [Lewinellaceae bacterium]|nr:DUF4331 family protein [Phaeodactylibacter sp.]MCB9037003.1 DUF4331 family protein [Lewinellaceae bacterium]